MRNFERTFVIKMLCLGMGAAGMVIACSSSEGDTASDDAGGGGDETGPGPGQDGSTLGDGAKPDGSIPPTKCAKNADCTSGVCNLATGLCAAANCKDGVKNATETDTDCGGSDCAKCATLKTCKVAGDCTTGICKDTDGKGLKCQAATCSDAAKNQDETDTDCGGLTCAKCDAGKACKVRGDCLTDVCDAATKKCITPACNDGAANGTETDVDCGGPGCPRCGDNLLCATAGDCTSGVCADVGAGVRCQPPSYTDTIQNGVETDIDCGGNPAYPCATGKKCKVGGDCASLGCDYTGVCAPARSCTGDLVNKTGNGTHTCGSGGAGGIGAQNWESCCTTIPVTTAQGTVYMDKYPTTSGRMRVFLESVGYDVRTAVQGMRAAGAIPAIPLTASNVVDGVNPVLDPSWDPFLPTGFGVTAAGEISDCAQAGTCALANGECPRSVNCTSDAVRQPGIYTAVRNHLGGNIFKGNSQTTTGCYVGGPGTHSFRFPDGMQDGDPAEQPQDVYDTKTQNCVDYLMAQAFCVWDGGRLETFQEWQAAWASGNATPYTAQTATVPVEPVDRCSSSTCVTGSGQVAIDAACGNDPMNRAYQCSSNKCCLIGGDKTYWGCRFPWATDATHPACGLSWPATKSIEYSDYKYSYEYPKLGGSDYIVHLSAPGRTAGRSPAGFSDIIGTGFELTSNVTTSVYVDPGGGAAPGNTGPFAALHRWTGNGSWEVHNYSRGYNGQSELLNKYGKLGMRCVKFAPN